MRVARKHATPQGGAAEPARGESAVNPLTALYPAIRKRIAAVAADARWPDLEEQVALHLVRPRLPPSLLLPPACAAAVGGDPERALSTAVACGYLLVAMRWFDDLQDRDRDGGLWQELGDGRASNLAAAALNLAWKTVAGDHELSSEARSAFGELTTDLARGQDLDLEGASTLGVEGYWGLMRGKSGAALALACRVGALAARPEAVEEAAHCGHFGCHMGSVLQILDDLDGTFRPVGLGDLAAGKLTLPVLYALERDHPGRTELAALVADGRLVVEAERARELLDATDTREFLLWGALEERRRGLTRLGDLPPPTTSIARAGRRALEAFADALLAGWERLLEPGPVPVSGRERTPPARGATDATTPGPSSYFERATKERSP